MAEKNDDSVTMIRKKLTDEDLKTMSEEEALERSYYENSIIIKVNDEQIIDDIATCFNIEDTMNYLMLAPLEFMSRTDGIENEKEYKERLWKQVRTFYKEAREILDRRYKL